MSEESLGRLKLILAKDDFFLVCALVVDDFGESEYKKLRRYLKEKFGEEFSLSRINGSLSLVKVIMVGLDHVSPVMIQEVLKNEMEKTKLWVSNSLVDTVESITKETKPEAKPGAKKRRSKRRGRKRKRTKSSRRSS